MIMALNSALCTIDKGYAADTFTTKVKNRMRKPVVEKMRRDRINSSINQLRTLLEQEFQLLQPDSKPEKADVLEIAVQFLQQRQRCIQQEMISHGPDHQEYRQGYHKCLSEALSYLSVHHTGQEAQLNLLNHFHQLDTHPKSLSHLQSPPKQQLQMANIKFLWRPW
ncbi:transcription factor HES-5-like [Anomaloglossus baeobatrachus]|uniref:transcription factor HES-5-like n=1 Tax=Anomaloglossus baeobatrachus TaxID=238106 RepID=UPI003F4F8697